MFYDWMEQLFAYIRGLPEGAQFFFCVALWLGFISLCGVALKLWERRLRSHALLDRQRRRKQRAPKTHARRVILNYWGLSIRRGNSSFYYYQFLPWPWRAREYQARILAERWRGVWQREREVAEIEGRPHRCPYCDPLHDHHDGCPSCWTEGN